MPGAPGVAGFDAICCAAAAQVSPAASTAAAATLCPLTCFISIRLLAWVVFESGGGSGAGLGPLPVRSPEATCMLVAMRVPVAGQLFVRLDPRAAEPLQAQICASIRRAILDGVLPPGARMPSSRALADDLGLSRTTTVLAYDQLAAEGYLSARSGSGTFVTRDLPEARLGPALVPRVAVGQLPRISRRGVALAATPSPSHKNQGPPRAFRLGTPALDRVPMPEWTRLVTRRLRSHTLTQLDYGAGVGLPALREAIASHMRRARGT